MSACHVCSGSGCFKCRMFEPGSWVRWAGRHNREDGRRTWQVVECSCGPCKEGVQVATDEPLVLGASSLGGRHVETSRIKRMRESGDESRRAQVQQLAMRRAVLDLDGRGNAFVPAEVDETLEQAKRREARERLAELKTGRVRPVYACATRTFREYGGPEEGGWWYDRTTIEETRRAFDFRGLLRHVRELLAEHETDPRGRGSVLGNRGDVVIYLVRNPLLLESLEGPEEKPRYE